LIGRTGLDIDLKRAAEELGITSKEEARELRKLEPGNFFAFGPAISTEVIPVKIGEVMTFHADIGSKQAAVAPAPPEKVRKMLEKLADLPKEAEEKQKTTESLQAEVRDLKRQLKERPAAAFDEERFKKETINLVRRIQKEFEDKAKHQMALVRQFMKDLQAVARLFRQSTEAFEALKIPEINLDSVMMNNVVLPIPQSPASIHIPKAEIRRASLAPVIDIDGKPLGACERAIAGYLAANPERSWSIEQVGIMTGYSAKSGGFNNSLSKLNTAGLILRENGQVQWAGNPVPAGVNVDREFTIDNIKAKLAKCEREIFEVVLAEPDQVDRIWDPAEIAAQTPSNYSPGSGGFNNSLSRLNSLGVLVRERGKIRLSNDTKELL
jgi:hypothetical protein